MLSKINHSFKDLFPQANLGHVLEHFSRFDIQNVSFQVSDFNASVFRGGNRMVTFFMCNILSSIIATLLLYFCDFKTAKNFDILKTVKKCIHKNNQEVEGQNRDSVAENYNFNDFGLRSNDNPSSFECAIKIERLYKSYGNHSVLRDLNLEIPKEKISILLGNNGCGKSTLM